MKEESITVICPDCTNIINVRKCEEFAECNECKLIWIWQEEDTKVAFAKEEVTE